MQRKIIRLLALLFCGLSIAVSAAAQSIHVEWGYTPPSEPAVTGFKLYQEGAPVCQTQNPNATAMDCEVTLTAATTNFTLTATFSDGSESPHSAPFAFTSDGSTGTDTSGDTGTTDDSATTKTPVSSSIGNKLFTFSWEQPTDLSNVAGYRFYLNSTRLCETTSPTDTSIACTANLLPGEMIFSMSQVHTDGSESGLSNLLVFNPTAYPETFTFKLLGFSWEYSGDASSISGFRIYQNNLPICETTDPAARNLTCTVDVPSGNLVYGVKAVNADGTESSLSNLLAYTPATTSTDDTATLQAVIQATPVTGTAPVTVNFNAGSSTGMISQYQWDFGDGSIAATSTASHEYASAGTYTAKLTVTNTTGASPTAGGVILSPWSHSFHRGGGRGGIAWSDGHGPFPIHLHIENIPITDDILLVRLGRSLLAEDFLAILLLGFVGNHSFAARFGSPGNAQPTTTENNPNDRLYGQGNCLHTLLAPKSFIR